MEWEFLLCGKTWEVPEKRHKNFMIIILDSFPELGIIYHHNIEIVTKLLGMKKINEFNYEMINNQVFFKDNKKHINNMVGGVFIPIKK